MQIFVEALQYDFMRNALITGVLVSIACGIVGTFVVAKRIVFISGGIAHAAFGGIGLGYLLGFNPVLGAMGFSLLAAMGMGVIQRKSHQRIDTLIGVLWAMGMALGIVFIDLAQGYKADLMSYLFGSILAVPVNDLFLMLLLDVIIVVVVALLYKELVAVSFDETYAEVQNVPVGLISTIMLCMIACTVVMVMRVVGIIMVIALLTIPAAISAKFLKDIRKIMVAACVLGVLFTTSGLILSYYLNLSSGALIILVAAAFYLLSLMIHPFHRKQEG